MVNFKFKCEKILCTFVSYDQMSAIICTKPSFWGARNIKHEDDFVAITLKRNELKVYIYLKGNKLVYFAN